MKKFFTLSLFVFSLQANAQNDTDDPGQAKVPEQQEKKEIFTYVQQMPEFPGGSAALQQFIAKHIVYPEDALDAEKEAKVIIKFIITETGAIENVTSMKPAGYGFDEEAIRVVQSMPLWKPGMQNGKPVNVYFQLPITFRLPRAIEDNE